MLHILSSPVTPRGEEEGQAHLQLPCHAHNIVVRWVVLVAVGEHESDVAGKLLRVPVFTTVNLPLMKR